MNGLTEWNVSSMANVGQVTISPKVRDMAVDNADNVLTVYCAEIYIDRERRSYGVDMPAHFRWEASEIVELRHSAQWLLKLWFLAYPTAWREPQSIEVELATFGQHVLQHWHFLGLTSNTLIYSDTVGGFSDWGITEEQS